MRTLFPRSTKGKAGRTDFGEVPADVFEQPERSLLGEALGKPVGLSAALILVASAGVFLANYLHLHMDRINDFALVGFFVGGGVLLSMLLRTSDSSAAMTKKKASPAPPADVSAELILDDQTYEEPVKQARAAGFAETPQRSVPVPPQAIIDPAKVKPAPEPADEEVATFQQALVHYSKAGDFHGQGEVLRRLGHVAKGRGHLKESREFYMNSRNCFRKINDHYAEAAVLLDLGQVLESLDEHDAASAAYRDANRALLDVAMSSGDRNNAIQAHAAD